VAVTGGHSLGIGHSLDYLFFRSRELVVRGACLVVKNVELVGRLEAHRSSLWEIFLYWI